MWYILRQLAMLLGILVLVGSHVQASASLSTRALCPDVPTTAPSSMPEPNAQLVNVLPNRLAPATRQPPTQPMGRVRCSTYVETEWGAGPGQWGLCPDSLSTLLPGPPPPAINDEGDVFVFDKRNWRVLRYADSRLIEAIPVSLPHKLGDECLFDFWRQLVISKDRLFIHSSVQKGERIVDQLSVLSLRGEVERLIDLEPYYPMTAGGLRFENQPPLIPDRQGGVYLRLAPAGVVHYDANLRPEFKYLGVERSLDEQLAVGWDGNVYAYDRPSDSLYYLGRDSRQFMQGGSGRTVGAAVSSPYTSSRTFGHLVGVDTPGRSYLRIVDEGPRWLVLRISNSGDKATLAELPPEISPPFELGPDGSLYSISEDSTSPGSSAGPKIIRCTMEPE